MSAPWIVQFKMRQRFTLTLIRCASGILYTRKMYLSRWCSMMRVISYEAVAMRIIRSSNKLMLRESSAISFRFVSFCVDGRLFSIILIVFCSVCVAFVAQNIYFVLFSWSFHLRSETKLLPKTFSFVCLYFVFHFHVYFSIQKFSLWFVRAPAAIWSFSTIDSYKIFSIFPKLNFISNYIHIDINKSKIH